MSNDGTDFNPWGGDDSSTSSGLPSAPQYLKAADLHNLGNVGSSWYDINPLNLPKFAAVSITSGLNSIYNTGVKIGNFFGADAQESNTEDAINNIFGDLDSDLGAYYQQNKPAADLAGFLVTSLVPGISGIKILNAGQKALAAANEGIIGTNLGMALGLRSAAIPRYIAQAGSEIAAGQAGFTSITSGAAKALSAGIYQDVLEGAAFETAVQATMQASPILSDQDGKDIAWNIATAGLFGGVLGGVFTAAKTVGAIRRAVIEESEIVNPYGQRNPLSFVSTGVKSDRVISLADDLEQGPALDPGDPNYAVEVKKLEDRQVRIRNDMRSAINDLVPGSDNDLGRMVADANQGNAAIDTMNTFMDADQIGRIGTKTKVEAEQAEYAKDGLFSAPELQVNYAKLTGENAGLVTDTAPAVTNLADRIVGTGGNSVRSSILADVRNQGFKIGDYWDAAKASLDTAGHLQAERRQIWASESLKEIPDGATVGFRDLPVLERALQDGQLDIKLVDGSGKIRKDKFGSQKELQDYVIAAKEDTASQLQLKAIKGKIAATAKGTEGLTDETQTAITTKIGKITNTTVGRLEGTAVKNDSDYFAWQGLQKQRDDFIASRDITHPKDIETDPRFLPTWAKITRRVRDKTDVNGNVIDGLTYIREKQVLAQQTVDNVVSKQAPSLVDQLPDIDNGTLASANNLGTGAGRFTINNPSYSSLGSFVSLIGSKLSDYARSVKEIFSDSSSGHLFNLAKNRDAVIEWSSINQKISRSAQMWVKTFDEDGNHALVEASAYQRMIKEGGTFDDLDDSSLIRFHNDETGALAEAHAQQERAMYLRRNERAAALSADQARTLEIGGEPIFRPIRPDPKQYPFFAFVKDPQVTGQGHTSMIFAQSGKELEAKAAVALRARPELQVWYKKDTEEFQKAEQEYQYDRTLSDNYIDSSLKNSGVYSDYFAKTDPQHVVDDYLQHHLRIIDTDARELIRSKYSAQFDWLEDQAHAFSRGTTSRFGGSFARLEAEASNPYLSYIKTALNLSRVQEAPLWYNINRFADQAVSGVVGKIQDIWGTNKEVAAADLESINSSLQKYGMNTGYYDAATQLLVNHQAPQAVLTKFVRGANAVLAKLTLGLDPLNGLVNALGANILRSTEIKQLVDAVSAGDSAIAGKIAALSKIDITGKGDLIRSPVKLMANAMKDFLPNSPDRAARLDLYTRLGLMKASIAKQFQSIIGDDLALRGTESANVLQSKLSAAIAKVGELSNQGQKYSGNLLAEQFNRFVSARTVELLTQPAVDRGIITQREQYAYMNTFVNRVEGNLVGSQRPFAFQGPIGQAIGLFQSYQFNIMQQMFRYVAEGNTKDAAMLLGLQGTFFGIQGLPAFQAINQHIIGTASGNQKHIDAYDALYGIAGKNLGDILTYGLPSKLLATNLYARGDINPRQLTILPTALEDVPIVGAYTKLFSGLKDTISKIAGGSNVWETFLQGVEHNGISRPLSGLAQTLQSTTGNGVPFSTTSKGSIMFSNDLFSMATLTRLSGGRPLDEAIVNDGVFRIHSYAQYDLARMQALSEEVKNSSIQGQILDDNQWGRFASQYQANGGKQVQFNKFMMREIRSANTSNVQTITSQLASPFAQKAQELMSDGSANIDPLNH